MSHPLEESWKATEADLRSALADVSDLPDEARGRAEEFIDHNEFGLAWSTIVSALGGELSRIEPASAGQALSRAVDRMGGASNLP